MITELLSTYPLLIGTVAAVLIGALFIALVCAISPQFGSDAAPSEPDAKHSKDLVWTAEHWGVAPPTPATPPPAPPPLVVVESDPQALIISESVSRAQLPANNRETFFPPPPHPNPQYEVRFSGILHTHTRIGRLADAFYATDHYGNFTERLKWLTRINGSPLCLFAHELVGADRCTHEYTIRFRQSGEQRLTLAISGYEARCFWHGVITAEVTVLPGEEDQARKLAQQAAEEQERVRRATQRAAAEQFARRITALCLRAEMYPNLSNPEFVAKYARAHTDELIIDEAKIRAEATQLLQQQQIVNFLRRHHPVALDRLLGRFQALNLAEQYALDKRLLPEAPPQKKKLNAAEVRSIIVHKQAVEIGDRVAKKLGKVDAKLKAREHLATMAFADDEERDAVEQELFREIDEAGDDDGNAQTL